MKSIEFKYEHVYYEGKRMGIRGYNTHLLITLFSRKKLRMMIGRVNPITARYIGSIVQTLVQNLQSVDIQGRRCAAEALGRFGPEGIRSLRKTLRTAANEDQRREAAKALGKIQEAVPHLQKAAKDQDDTVRTVATQALQRIQVPWGESGSG